LVAVDENLLAVSQAFVHERDGCIEYDWREEAWVIGVNEIQDETLAATRQ
jgi:hypothetical protein